MFICEPKMMPNEFLLILFASTFALALPMTWYVRIVAVRRGQLDHPSQRSSHSVPTPRGGGLAIVAAHFIALTVLQVSGYITAQESIALMGGGGGVALVGFMDDRKSVPATVRIVVHLAAAIFVVAMIGGVRISGL